MTPLDLHGNAGPKEPATKAEFYRMIGTTPELAKFADEFLQRPAMLGSLSLEKRHQIKAQIDAVLKFFRYGAAVSGSKKSPQLPR